MTVSAVQRSQVHTEFIRAVLLKITACVDINIVNKSGDSKRKIAGQK